MSKAKAKQPTYKVWVDIEEMQPDGEHGQDVDAPGACVIELPTYDEAWAFAEALQQFGECLATSQLARLKHKAERRKC